MNGDHPPLGRQPSLEVSDRYKDGRSLRPGTWEPVGLVVKDGETRPETWTWSCDCGESAMTHREDVGKTRPCFIVVWMCPTHGPVCPPPSLGCIDPGGQ